MIDTDIDTSVCFWERDSEGGQVLREAKHGKVVGGVQRRTPTTNPPSSVSGSRPIWVAWHGRSSRSFVLLREAKEQVEVWATADQ